MLKFPVVKLFTSDFTMEMISLPMLLTKKLLDQRKTPFKLILMHLKNICKFNNFFHVGYMCLHFKKITFLAAVVFVNSVFMCCLLKEILSQHRIRHLGSYRVSFLPTK